MNEGVAGESGFVRLTPDGNGFALGSGAPVRFWAVNSEVFRQDPAAIDRNVRFLARIGVNMVRLHAQISPKGPNSRPTQVDEKEIDGIWRYVRRREGAGDLHHDFPLVVAYRRCCEVGDRGVRGGEALKGSCSLMRTSRRPTKPGPRRS